MLERLHLRQFRCFEELTLEPLPRHAVFVGDNAQGKTSILEAACLLMRLQSPRTSTRRDLIRHEAPHLVIEGRWHDTRLRFACNQQTRRLAAGDRSSLPAAEYLGHSGLVVWIGNRDLQLVHGPAEQRRRFLDFVASQLFPPYRHALKAYERALRSRNHLLKRHDPPPWRQLDAYDQLLLDHGRILIESRHQLAAALRQPLDTAHRQLAAGDGATETAEADYQPSVEAGQFAAALEQNRREDARLRQTTAGPHRDELDLRLNRRSAGRFGSEGQQRSLALALKLAQAHLLHAHSGQPPMMLIDDIFGELDPGRRNAFIGHLPADTQTLVTTTHLDWLQQLPADTRVFRVADGRVEPVEPASPAAD